MCQQEVINYLKKRRGKDVDIQELMRVIPANRISISRSCRKLAEYQEIKVKQVRQGPFIKFLFSI